jgi:ABC-2 type transport system ATP-binding protein
MIVVEAIGLGKRYGRTWALRECSLAIPAGHVAALVGPNGAGNYYVDSTHSGGERAKISVLLPLAAMSSEDAADLLVMAEHQLTLIQTTSTARQPAEGPALLRLNVLASLLAGCTDA